MTSEALHSVTRGTRRAALYLSKPLYEGSNQLALKECNLQAQQQGLRVVSVVVEDRKRALMQKREGLGGKRLLSLVDQLGEGHLDIIVAHMGDAMVTIAAPAHVHQTEVVK